MQASDGVSIQQRWGDKPCDHPRFSKEYILGANTGDWICSFCGETFTSDEHREIVENRKVKKMNIRNEADDVYTAVPELDATNSPMRDKQGGRFYRVTVTNGDHPAQTHSVGIKGESISLQPYSSLDTVKLKEAILLCDNSMTKTP